LDDLGCWVLGAGCWVLGAPLFFWHELCNYLIEELNLQIKIKGHEKSFAYFASRTPGDGRDNNEGSGSCG
jgi:hypothetical protein